MSATGSLCAPVQACRWELAQAAPGSGGVGLDPVVSVGGACAAARFDGLAGQEEAGCAPGSPGQ